MKELVEKIQHIVAKGFAEEGKACTKVSPVAISWMLKSIYLSEHYIFQAIKEAVYSPSAETDIEAAALMLFHIDRLLAIACGRNSPNFKEAIKLAEEKLKQFVPEDDDEYSPKEILSWVKEMRNDLVHYGSLDFSSVLYSTRTAGMHEISFSDTPSFITCLLVYVLSLYSASTHKFPKTPTPHMKRQWFFYRLRFQIKYGTWKTVNYIKDLLRFPKLILQALRKAVGNIYVSAITMVIICIATLLLSFVAWGIVRWNQTKYDVRTTDPAKLSEIVADAKPIEQSEAMRDRYTALHELGKYYKVGDPERDPSDVTTTELYEYAVAHKLPDYRTNHSLDHILWWLPISNPGKFKYLLASERGSKRQPERVARELEDDMRPIDKWMLRGRRLVPGTFQALAAYPSIQVIVSIGRPDNKLFVSEVKEYFRKVAKEEGFNTSRLIFKEDATQPSELRIYAKGVPTRR